VQVRISNGQLERQAAEANRVLFRLIAGAPTTPVLLEAAVAQEPTPRATATAEVRAASTEVAAVPAVSSAGPQGRRLEVGAAVGVFYAGGNNIGPAFAATLAWAPWRFPLFLELELGVRAAWFSDTVSGLGTASSTLVVFPIELAVRGPVWSSGRWRLDLRAGGGLLLGTNWVSSDFGQGTSNAVNGFEVFGAAQLSCRAGNFLPYLELRGAYALATGTGLTANPAGLVVLVGFHWQRSLR
jgi:hypothetical protein